MPMLSCTTHNRLVIKVDDLPYLTEAYYKGFQTANAALPRKSSHLGLGLTIVESILELHQSHLGIESVYGEGTTCSFELYKTMRLTRGNYR